MKYSNGIDVRLGDIISIDIPEGYRTARVVMLGNTMDHLDIDPKFLDWVNKENLIDESQVVVEWIGENPFKHNDPKYAPVGNYMFTEIDDCVIFKDRGK